MRRDVGGKTDPLEYKKKKAQLEEFKRLEDEGKYEVFKYIPHRVSRPKTHCYDQTYY